MGPFQGIPSVGVTPSSLCIRLHAKGQADTPSSKFGWDQGTDSSKTLGFQASLQLGRDLCFRAPQALESLP